MTRPEIEALRALYREPDDALAASLAKQCVDLGDCISSQLAELARDPSRDRCDRVIHNLRGVIQHIQRLHAAQDGGERG